jgi:hypothetical protein
MRVNFWGAALSLVLVASPAVAQTTIPCGDTATMVPANTQLYFEVCANTTSIDGQSIGIDAVQILLDGLPLLIARPPVAIETAGTAVKYRLGPATIGAGTHTVGAQTATIFDQFCIGDSISIVPECAGKEYGTFVQRSLWSAPLTRTIDATTDQPPPPPPACVFLLAPAPMPLPAAGWFGGFQVSASAPDCPWTLTNSASSWLHLAPTTGTGSITTAVTADANATTTQRTATLAFDAGGTQAYSITQEAGQAPPPTGCTDGTALFPLGKQLTVYTRVRGDLIANPDYQRMIAGGWTYLYADRVRANYYNLVFRCGA